MECFARTKNPSAGTEHVMFKSHRLRILLKMNIRTKNESENECLVKDIVSNLISRYDIPTFTDNVVIEDEVIPHSHPVLTLGTRVIEPFLILKTLIHEQFHWFEAGHYKYKEAMEFLKSNYKDLGDCGKNSDSFWQHLIVCWNTRNFLQNNFDSKEVENTYSFKQPYSLTEVFVKENFERLKDDLGKFEMVYDKK